MYKEYRVFATIMAVVLLSVSVVQAQRKSRDKSQPVVVDQPYVTPKLVVGIIVDQMRYDYLTRFWGQYGQGGFKRLVNDGFSCRNNHFNYIPTKTACGHASVYTGTTPAIHGIIANDWYDKTEDEEIYCVTDNRFKSVGSSSDAGQRSPHRLAVSTITDQLRLHTQMRGKVIAVALKDRGAILPGGHTANGAYWLKEGNEGKWITSSYYMEELPAWVQSFNASNAVEAYKKAWTPLKASGNYPESDPDNTPYEGRFSGEAAPVFPHDLPALWDQNEGYGILWKTPFGNSMTIDFAIAALDGEQLGADQTTDFLAVSLSSTDKVGHQFGLNARETQDTYLRLDQDLARMLNVLDQKIGAGEYTVFLTADHGASHVPAYLKDLNIPAGYYATADLEKRLIEFLKYKYGITDLLKFISNNQIFLDHKVIDNLDLSLSEVQETLAAEVLKYEEVNMVYTANQMKTNGYLRGIPSLLQNGYNQKRSGDILLVMKPSTLDYSRTGTGHESPYNYDTHVPLLFYGKGIKKGSTVRRTEITDIAPTLAALLGIAFPNGSSGDPIPQVLK